MSKGLVLMIHGLGGGASTWGSFPALLAADLHIADRFAIEPPYVYTTGLAGRGPGIADLARELATHLNRPELADYSQIAILAHSLGGLVARRLVADMIIEGAPPRISRIMTFASPLLGAGAASVSKLIPGTGTQHRDLAIGSDFMIALGRDWANTGADSMVQVRTVVAGDDGVVAAWSATAGFRYASYDTIGGADHRSIVKPPNASARSFQLARDFLLDAKPAWHRAPGSIHYEQPVLDASVLPDGRPARANVSRFVYRARAVPFFGRQREWEALTQFISSADPFRWMVISGAGGVGKSRLALELCLALASDWYAGFLSDRERARDWDRWQPLAPTLMVLDYATRNTGLARELLHALARRTMPDAAFPLPHPVRVLMLIREGDERSLSDDVVNRGDAVMPVKLTGASTFFALGEIADPWPIFETVYLHAGRAMPDKAPTLRALARIDRQVRPLFAYFLADAMVSTHDGMPDPRNFDSDRLVEDVIDRWRAQFWRPAFESAGLGQGNAEETLLALATMCNGVPIKNGDLPEAKLARLLPTWDPYLHPLVMQAMTGKLSGDLVPTLEPDIVGEHFVVARLAERTEAERQELIDLAWEIDPVGAASFIDRFSQSVCDTTVRAAVQASLFRQPTRLSTRVAVSRSILCVNLLARIGTRDPHAGQVQLDEIEAYAGELGGAPLRELWATGAVNFLHYLSAHDPHAARVLIDEMKTYADEQGEAPLREWWSKGAYNLLNALGTSDPHAAQVLLDEMNAYADEHEQAFLRESWAMGAVNLLRDLGARDPDAALALLLKIRTYAEEHGEAPLREQWAQGAVNLLGGDFRTQDPHTARMLLDEMKTYADEHGEATLREWWAKGAVNLLRDLGANDPHAARVLLDEIKAYADEHGEAPLSEAWSRGAFDLLYDIGARDLDLALALHAEMKTYADEHEDAPLRKWWAKGAVNLLKELRTRDLDAARVLVDEMKTYADEHGEAPLRELWSMGAVNLVLDLGTRDPEASLALLLKMKACADKHGEARLREQWAKGIVNVLSDLGVRDPCAARVLLDEMKTYADEHGEATLREWWSKGAINLLYGARDLDLALALHAEMKTYADEHGEAPLRESWSMGAVNLLRDLGARDPDTSLALLHMMKAYADEFGEAPLREQWAHGAYNLLSDLRTRDPRAARVLLAEMETYADEHGEAPLRDWWTKGAVDLLSDPATRDPDAD